MRSGTNFNDADTTTSEAIQQSTTFAADDYTDTRFVDDGRNTMDQQQMTREMDVDDDRAAAHNNVIAESNEENLTDLRHTYGEPSQLGNAPYFSNPPIDPTLDTTNLDESMASVNIQAESELSPSQGYVGDISSEAITPSKGELAMGKRGTFAERQQGIEAEDSGEQDEDGEFDGEMNDDKDDDFAPEPVIAKTTRTPRSASKRKVATPKKTKSAAKPPKARKSTGKSKSDVPFNRQRRAPKNGIMEGRIIPRSYEECDRADKALIDLREKEQKTWKEIRQAWEEMTGQKTGNSTLPNRYERLKDNFSIIKEEDRPRLLEAKEEVEREMANMKWSLIADKVKASGGDQYAPDNLQRQYKKLMLKEGLRPPPGIVDQDFGIAVSEDEAEDDD